MQLASTSFSEAQPSRRHSRNICSPLALAATPAMIIELITLAAAVGHGRIPFLEGQFLFRNGKRPGARQPVRSAA
jgi:hypothetical protein